MQMATMTVKNRKHNSSASVRLVLDSGSQRSYITEKLAKVLKLTLDLQFLKGEFAEGKLADSLPYHAESSSIGKINCVPLKEEDLQFLKGEFAEGKLADSLPYHAE